MGGLVPPVVTMSEAQAYVRIETGEEEAVLAGLVRSASALCEAFLGQVIIARPFIVEMPACVTWLRLPIAPVRTIDTAATLDASGTSTALAIDEYAIDIDASGDGWLRTEAHVEATRMQERRPTRKLGARSPPSWQRYVATA